MFHRPPPALQRAGQWLTHTCLALCRVDVGGWPVCSEAPHCLPLKVVGSGVPRYTPAVTYAGLQPVLEGERIVVVVLTSLHPILWNGLHSTQQIKFP